MKWHNCPPRILNDSGLYETKIWKKNIRYLGQQGPYRFPSTEGGRSTMAQLFWMVSRYNDRSVSWYRSIEMNKTKLGIYVYLPTRACRTGKYGWEKTYRLTQTQKKYWSDCHWCWRMACIMSILMLPRRRLEPLTNWLKGRRSYHCANEGAEWIRVQKH